MACRPAFLFAVLAATGAGAVRAAEAPLTVPVAVLTTAPTVDGTVDEWPPAAWVRVPVRPADDDVEYKAVGRIEVEIAAGVFGHRFYVAARWPDEAPNIDYRPWRWAGSAYRRSDDRDDMFALRFELDGDYDRCMITDKTYAVDLWLWSAARSNPANQAEDMTHRFTTALTDSAAEYKLPSGATVYITKRRDEGTAAYATVRAGKQFTDESLPSIRHGDPADGSVADVAAKGLWAEGRWTLELSRFLDTGQSDDAVFALGQVRRGAIAVFNRSHSENKSVSGTLIFRFPAGG